VVTDADRAAMDRAADLVPIPVALPTADQLRAHVLAKARRE
jgi:hypothetical protein